MRLLSRIRAYVTLYLTRTCSEREGEGEEEEEELPPPPPSVAVERSPGHEDDAVLMKISDLVVSSTSR